MLLWPGFDCAPRSCALPTAHPGGEGRPLGFQQRARALFLRLLRGAAAAAAGQDGAAQPPRPHGNRHRNRPTPRLSPDPAAKGGPGALGHPRRIFALDFGTELLLSRRMIYSACGLAYSLFKISCWLGKCGKDIWNPGMGVDFSQCLSEARHCAGSGELL